MSKIAKFIASALNNSSANEAAQALKMAAVSMQNEGANPADFLQHKNTNSDDYALLQAAHDQLLDVHEALLAKYHAAQASGNTAELREAKQLAIKWHKIATSQEAQLSELAVEAVRLAELEKAHYNRAVDWKNRAITAGVVGVFAALVAFGWGNSNGEDFGRTAQASVNWEALQAKDNEISQLKGQVADARATVAAYANGYAKDSAANPDEVATCWIQGKYSLKDVKDDKLTTLKFWFNNGVLTTFRNGRITDRSKTSYDHTTFLQKVNEAFPGKTNCKLGVNK